MSKLIHTFESIDYRYIKLVAINNELFIIYQIHYSRGARRFHREITRITTNTNTGEHTIANTRVRLKNGHRFLDRLIPMDEDEIKELDFQYKERVKRSIYDLPHPIFKNLR
jgi:hypothetical protein